MSRALNANGTVHAMHDPTEGGLITALHELAEAAGVGLRIDKAAIPVLPACRVICEALEVDPLGLLASGALLAALDPAEVPAAIGRLGALGIAMAAIGEIFPAARGRRLRTRAGFYRCQRSHGTSWRDTWNARVGPTTKRGSSSGPSVNS
jgi:hydrogenase maturation factor